MKQSEQQAYYADLWQQRGVSIGDDELSRMQEIRKAIRFWKTTFHRDGPSQILDFGCGAGWLGQFLSPFGEIHAADIDPSTIERATAVFPNIHFYVLKEDLPLYGLHQDSYDIIISTEVIEHIVDKQYFIEFLYSLLVPGGLLVLTTPRGELFSLWAAWVKGKQQPVEEWLSTQELRQFVLVNGFNILYQKWFYYTRINNLFRDKLLSTRLLCLAKRVGLLTPIWRWLTDRYGIYQIMVATKSEFSSQHLT